MDLLAEIEHRPERYGADRDPSVIKHPNGTSMVCSQPEMVVAMTLAVLEIYERSET